jgi:hypothetical protein
VLARCFLAVAVFAGAPAVDARPSPPVSADACARHVNRLLSARAGRRVRGNAWDVQLLPSNQALLALRWRAAGRGDGDRVADFRALYAALDAEPRPAGVVGFMFGDSIWRERVQAMRKVLPQTHVALVVGRRQFALENTARSPRSVRAILGDTLVAITPEERALVERRIGASLDEKLAPGARHIYLDYLLLQHFVREREGALLEMLRKLRLDRSHAMFRPVSFSQLAGER